MKKNPKTDAEAREFAAAAAKQLRRVNKAALDKVNTLADLKTAMKLASGDMAVLVRQAEEDES